MISENTSEGETVDAKVADKKTLKSLPALPLGAKLPTFSFLDAVHASPQRADQPYTSTQDRTEQFTNYTEEKIEDVKQPMTPKKQESPVRPYDCISPKLALQSQDISPANSNVWKLQNERVLEDVTTESSEGEGDYSETQCPSVCVNESTTPTPQGTRMKPLSRGPSQTQLDATGHSSNDVAVAAAMPSCAAQTSTAKQEGVMAPLNSTKKTSAMPVRVQMANLSPCQIDVSTLHTHLDAEPMKTHVFHGNNKKSGDVHDDDGDGKRDPNGNLEELRRTHRDEVPVGIGGRNFGELLDTYWESAHNVDLRSVIMMLLTTVAFVLTLVGLPLSQVDVVGGSCYTYWGYKEDCDARYYTNRTTFMTCSQMARRLDAGAVFSVFTFALLSIGLFFSFLILFRGNMVWRIPLVILLCIAFLTQMIAWGLVANVYVSRFCEDKYLPRTDAYGVAFGMSLTSWFILLLDVFIGVIPESLFERIRHHKLL